MNTNELGAADPQPKKLPCPDSLPALPPLPRLRRTRRTPSPPSEGERHLAGSGAQCAHIVRRMENSRKSVIRVHSCPFVVERVRPGLVASVFGVFTRILGDFSEGKNCRIIRNIGWAARTRLGFNTVAGRWVREESPPDFARGSGR